MKTVIDGLKWRYATSKFDTSKKITEEDLDALLQATILAPSSFGLQPFKIIVVSNPEIRAQLLLAGYGQPKIAESSHFIIFAAKTDITDKTVDEYMANVSKIRGVPVDALKGFGDMIKGSFTGQTPEQLTNWATKQAYIALGVLIATASVGKIDIAPMEGFDSKKFDEILGLGAMNLESKVIAAVGYRAEDDATAQYKKVRFPKEEIVIEVK